MKKNVLPKGIQEKLEQYEENWETMTDAKFEDIVQRLERQDQLERDRKDRKKVARKASKKRKNSDESEDDNTNSNTKYNNLNRVQRNTNKKTKRSKNNGKESSSRGEARFCALCEVAGAPESVYTSHNTKDCRKKGYYKKAMCGTAGKRKEAGDEFKASEKKASKKAKREFKQFKLWQKQQKRKRDSVDMSESSDDDSSTDVSF